MSFKTFGLNSHSIKYHSRTTRVDVSTGTSRPKIPSSKMRDFPICSSPVDWDEKMEQEHVTLEPKGKGVPGRERGLIGFEDKDEEQEEHGARQVGGGKESLGILSGKVDHRDESHGDRPWPPCRLGLD